MIWTTCSHSLCVFLKTFYREPYRPWSGTLEKEKKIDKWISFDIVFFFSSISYPRFRTRNCFFWKIIMSGTCSYQHEISKPDSPHTKINHLRGATTVERWPVTSWEGNRKLGIYTGISNFSNDWVIWVAGILRDTDILPYRLSWWYRDSMARAILYYQWHLNWGSVIQDIQVSSLRSRWHRTTYGSSHISSFSKISVSIAVLQPHCLTSLDWLLLIDPWNFFSSCRSFLRSLPMTKQPSKVTNQFQPKV